MENLNSLLRDISYRHLNLLLMIVNIYVAVSISLIIYNITIIADAILTVADIQECV